ncbi:Homeodomain-like DNA binding domain-containing transcription factor [Phycomyces blakesleeanus NRRL 1555(-)]|uniref:Homeodomain-like DNA binding domain-containing transcription factor n=1 Tax=Phycomyces blakesleeanus (strain ATCC 8743b / DSM 1359 / FGSC 10004 / NBRC 33097 / NRRL 1555) TaxID=763407 RepID=A0A167MK71_PHYB8|nr:Homeodomain-like DNA binding domain-containing transcription factor [Phycomyces blakesleeanus NRRL 1555(-)]OAD73084.1 Homeodomain-like DNA binding domain-containing transcription factor [Phycomyces blakesleeanus NRRL 1555(-)]|eukprot:XP_018291124.1 Homeodomain-like DNA binding domain-containing transcription factor [Phycomyces blakesleeanus NRRL 1555(-)]
MPNTQKNNSHGPYNVLSDLTKEKILGLQLAGNNVASISAKLNVPKSTSSGRPQILTPRDKRRIVSNLKKDRWSMLDDLVDDASADTG